jgi:hypothetical protein
MLAGIALVAAQSPYYDIPAYYGHFSLNFFEPSALSEAKFAYFEYHFAADASYDQQTLFLAHEAEHCIYTFSNATGEVAAFAGNCGIAGNILGSVLNAEFNGVSSLAYYQPPSPAILAELNNQALYLVANGTCDLNETDCLLSPPYGNLTMDNLRFQPEIDLYAVEEGQEEFLYVADTGNHCIKRIAIAAMEVAVVAGICGSQGFLDGPMGYNKLNFPRNLGVTRAGTVYFFDSGNEYIRIINSNGNVETLLLGACKESKFGFDVGG